MSEPWKDYQQAPSETAGPWQAFQGFDHAAKVVLKEEGGWVDDPDDSGGETKFGISQKAYPNVDIKALTEEDALALYKRDYWDAIGADNLPSSIRQLAFDAAVNQGVGWTKKALEESGGDPAKLWTLRKQRYDSIVENRPKDKKFQRGWMNRLDRHVPEGPWQDYRGQK